LGTEFIVGCFVSNDVLVCQCPLREGTISTLRKEADEMTEQKQRLTARRKLELYKETRPEDANLGEVLRRYGVPTNDLRRIEALVEAAAVEALKVRHNGQAPAGVSRAEYESIKSQTFAARRAYNRAVRDQHKVVRADIS
jgi:hypothetical protein